MYEWRIEIIRSVTRNKQHTRMPSNAEAAQHEVGEVGEEQSEGGRVVSPYSSSLHPSRHHKTGTKQPAQNNDDPSFNQTDGIGPTG